MTDETPEHADERAFDEAAAFGERFLLDPLIAEALFRLPRQDEQSAIEDLIRATQDNDEGARRSAYNRIQAARYFRTYAEEMAQRLRDIASAEGTADY